MNRIDWNVVLGALLLILVVSFISSDGWWLR